MTRKTSENDSTLSKLKIQGLTYTLTLPTCIKQLLIQTRGGLSSSDSERVSASWAINRKSESVSSLSAVLLPLPALMLQMSKWTEVVTSDLSLSSTGRGWLIFYTTLQDKLWLWSALSVWSIFRGTKSRKSLIKSAVLISDAWLENKMPHRCKMLRNFVDFFSRYFASLQKGIVL